MSCHSTRRDAVRRNRLDGASRGKGGWYTGWRYMSVLGGILMRIEGYLLRMDYLQDQLALQMGINSARPADQQPHRSVPPIVPSFGLMRGGFSRRRASRRRNGCLLQSRGRLGLAWLSFACPLPTTSDVPWTEFLSKMQQICARMGRRSGGEQVAGFHFPVCRAAGSESVSLPWMGGAVPEWITAYARRACRP